MAVVHTINNMGSCRSVDYDNATKQVWNWANERRIRLTASHIAGVHNIEAEKESGV